MLSYLGGLLVYFVKQSRLYVELLAVVLLQTIQML